MARDRKKNKRGSRKPASKPEGESIKLSRDQARRSKPIGHEYVRRKAMPSGEVRLTFMVPARGMAKWLLRLPDKVEKTVALDAVGIQIFDLCDGETTVDQIVQKYTKRYKVDRHEAEIAVTTFMRSLVQRGLVTMMVPKK